MFWFSPVYRGTIAFPERLVPALLSRWRGALPDENDGSVMRSPAELWRPECADGSSLVFPRLDVRSEPSVQQAIADELERSEVIVFIVSTSFLTHGVGDCFCFDMPGVIDRLRFPDRHREMEPPPFSLKGIRELSLGPATARWGNARHLVRPLMPIADRIEAVCRAVGSQIIERCCDLLPFKRLPLSPHIEWRKGYIGCVCKRSAGLEEQAGAGAGAMHLITWSASGVDVALRRERPYLDARLIIDPQARWKAFATPLNTASGGSSFGFDTCIHGPPLFAEGANAMPPERTPALTPPTQNLRKRKKKPVTRPPEAAKAKVKPVPPGTIRDIKDIVVRIDLSNCDVNGPQAGGASSLPADGSAPPQDDPMGLAIFDQFKGQRPADPALRLSICEIVRNLERAKPGCLARSLEDDDAGSVLLSLHRGGKLLN